MAKHLVVGAGGIGAATARHLVAEGHEVVLASRSGRDAGVAGVRALPLDAADAEALTAAARGAASVVNAVNPPRYDRWARDWPPVAAAMLAAARATGTGLVTVSNLYGYGPVAGPLTPDLPLRATGTKGRVRARMWADALAAHQAGDLRAAELRASDYFGPGAGRGVSMLNRFVIGPAAAGRKVRLVVGDPDAPHSWTYLDDIGALAARLATDDRSWGRAWHVPSSPPRSAREVATDVTALVGRPTPDVARMAAAIRLMARVAPVVRELDETAYQFDAPFVLDASATTEVFGLAPTPWADALRATVAWLGAQR